jgi:hypothetical protein
MKKKYFRLEPEVAGQLGGNTVLDNSVHPPIVKQLQYIIFGWLGDCLVESFPVFLIRLEAANELIDLNVSGLELKELEVKTAEEFKDL